MGFGIQGLSGSSLSNRLEHIKSALQDLPNSALSADVSETATNLIEAIQDGVNAGRLTESGLNTIRNLFDKLQVEVDQLGFGTEVSDNLGRTKPSQSIDDTAASANMPLPPIPPQFQIFQVKPADDVSVSISVDGGTTTEIAVPHGMIHAAAAGDPTALDRLQAKLQAAFATEQSSDTSNASDKATVSLTADILASVSIGDAATIQKIAQVIDVQLADNDPKRDGNRAAFVATLIPTKDQSSTFAATAAGALGVGGVISTNRARIISKIEEILAPYNDPKATTTTDETGLSEDEQRNLELILTSLVDGINSMDELQLIAAWLSQAPGLTMSVPTLLDTIQWAIQDFVAMEALNATPDQRKAIVTQINTKMGAAVTGFNAISDDEATDIIAQSAASSGASVSPEDEAVPLSQASDTERDQSTHSATPPPPMGFVPPPPRLNKDTLETAVDFNQLVTSVTAVSATSDSQGDTDSDRNAALREAARFKQKGDKLIDDVTWYLQSVCEVAADVQLNKMSADLSQFGFKSLGA